MALSSALGGQREAVLTGARVRYRERGQGAPVVFVHGLLVTGDIWRGVVPGVAEAGYRCLTPDWPLGSHEVPVPDADLSPPGVAALIAEFLEVLDLDDVTIVANDTGGALTQILLADHPARVGRVVLVSCDAFELFFPPPFNALTSMVKVPGVTWTMMQSMRVPALRRLPMAFGWVAKRPIPREIADSYVASSQRSAAIRRDLRRFVAGVDSRYTIAAAKRLGEFDKPVLLAWAREDKLFPVSLAQRLADVLPKAELRLVDDCYTFVSEDQPEALSRLVVDFLGAHATP